MTDITFFGQGAGTYEYDMALPVGTTTGTDGNELIVGGKNPSIIEGGAGDDILVGGEIQAGNEKSQQSGEYTVTKSGAADTFVFNFTVEKTEGTVFYFRSNEDGTGSDTPSSSANLQAWTNYVNQANAWHAEMESKYGADADASQTEAFATVKKVATSAGLYDNSFEIAGSLEITSSDGHDVIIDFGSEDKLDLKGLSGIKFNDFDTLFDVVSNEKATTLTWEGGSITINGLGIDDGVVGDASFFNLATSKGWFTGDFV
jgi:hypothetical protein